jgi:hypothetical protein
MLAGSNVAGHQQSADWKVLGTVDTSTKARHRFGIKAN